MGYGSELQGLNSINADAAAFVVRAILFSALGILALVAFILARGTLRRRYSDRLASAGPPTCGSIWSKVLSGDILRRTTGARGTTMRKRS